MKNRRRLLIVLGATAFALRAVFAQAKQAPVLIGWLHGDSRKSSGHYLAAFTEALAALGWKEGSQFAIEERWADGQYSRLQSLAEELAAHKPAVIVAAPLSSVPAASKAAPKTPIVIASGGDPVASGLVKSLARPGGMITGVTSFTADIAEKYLELLLAAAPNVKRVGVLDDSASRIATSSQNNPQKEAILRSVAQYRVEARFAAAANPDEIEPAIARLAKDGAQGLIVIVSAMLRNERQRIVKLALAQRWPIVAGVPEFAEAGALLSYGVVVLANYRRAAYYVDRILKGAKPADLPIERPTKFELVINMKTAKSLGIKIPNSILVQATKVIE